MKHTLIITALFIVIGCAYDNAEELYGEAGCPPNGVSFTQNIEPIIQNNCAISGCHVNGRQLPALETYEQIAANAQRILFRTSNGTMPPVSSGKSLTQEDIHQIDCWLKLGAPDN
jgi:hypothetical protein